MNKQESSFSINELIIIFCAATWVGSITAVANDESYKIDLWFLFLCSITFCIVPIEYHTNKFWESISKRYVSEASILAERDSSWLVIIDTFRILFLSLCFIFIKIPLGVHSDPSEFTNHNFYLSFIGLYLILGFVWNLIALAESRDRTTGGGGKVYGKYFLFFDNYKKSPEYLNGENIAYIDLRLNGRRIVYVNFCHLVNWFQSVNLFIHGVLYPIVGVAILALCAYNFFDATGHSLTSIHTAKLLPQLTGFIAVAFFVSQLFFKIFQNAVLTIMIDGGGNGQKGSVAHV